MDPLDNTLIEAYVPISRSFIKGKNEGAVVAATALNNAPKHNLVNGKRVESGDYILVDTSDRTITDGGMFLVRDGAILELVKILHTEQGYQFHRTRDKFIHIDDNPEQFIIGKAFEVLKGRKDLA